MRTTLSLMEVSDSSGIWNSVIVLVVSTKVEVVLSVCKYFGEFILVVDMVFAAWTAEVWKCGER